jgi:phage terminase Nu1 subunit (DNA packaging protein)
MPDLAQTIPEVRRANKAQAAHFFDITLPTLEKWIRDGMPIVQRGARGVSWVLDLLDIAQWRFGARLPSGEIDPDTLAPMERDKWYASEIKRRDLQKRDRQLLEVGDVEEAVSTAFSAMAQALFALPDFLERRAGMSPEQAETCQAAIYQTMNDLADRLVEFAPVEGAKAGEGAA